MNNEVSILTTIQKLIAHEKSARAIGSIEEAETFAAKIQDLMFRHKLEMTDIEYAEQEKNEPVLSELWEEADLTRRVRESARRQTWAEILLQAVVEANFCRSVGWPPWRHVIFGRASDRAAAKALFQYLYHACVEVAPAHTKTKCKGWNREAKRRFTIGFKVGFAAGVVKRLRVQKAELRAGARPEGLVRIDQLERSVERKVKEEFPNVITERRRVRTSCYQGFSDGELYGGSIGINARKRLKE